MSGEDLNKCDKHGQQLRSLEARVYKLEEKSDNYSTELARNTLMTENLCATVEKFSTAVLSLDKTLIKVDVNMEHMSESLGTVKNELIKLKNDTNKKLEDLEGKMCDEEAKNKIDIRMLLKNIFLFFLAPSSVVGSIILLILKFTEKI